MIDIYQFKIGDQVQFTQERLDCLLPRDRNYLQDRIGYIEGFVESKRKPIVNFPAKEKKGNIRLFGVDWRQLEIVKSSTQNIETENTNLNDKLSADNNTTNNANLSQDSIDDLFN